MRSEDKTQRARRKLRALVRSKRRAQSAGPESALAPALANAIATAHAAYALCAKKTSDPNVAVAANNAAASLAASFAIAPLRLGDRLRLEWLGAMRGADARLLGECTRVLGDAISGDATVTDRIRLASAEAYSLTQAVSRSSEAAWRASQSSVAFLSFAR